MVWVCLDCTLQAGAYYRSAAAVVEARAQLELRHAANLAYREFVRIDLNKVPDAKTLARIAQALGGEVIEKLHHRPMGLAQERGALLSARCMSFKNGSSASGVCTSSCYCRAYYFCGSWRLGRWATTVASIRSFTGYSHS
jgi:hypothetical protein